MADILLRTPYFLNITTASHLSAKLELTIDSTLRYTIVKNAISNRTVFELSTLAKDYYVPDYGGATGDDVDTVSISATWYAYDAADGGGSQLATATVTHTGYYGYNSFWVGYSDLDTTDIPSSLRPEEVAPSTNLSLFLIINSTISNLVLPSYLPLLISKEAHLSSLRDTNEYDSVILKTPPNYPTPSLHTYL